MWSCLYSSWQKQTNLNRNVLTKDFSRTRLILYTNIWKLSASVRTHWAWPSSPHPVSITDDEINDTLSLVWALVECNHYIVELITTNTSLVPRPSLFAGCPVLTCKTLVWKQHYIRFQVWQWQLLMFHPLLARSWLAKKCSIEVVRINCSHDCSAHMTVVMTFTILQEGAESLTKMAAGIVQVCKHQTPNCVVHC